MTIQEKEEAAVAQFLAEWRKLPPLIRAGAADEWRIQAARTSTREDAAASNAGITGLTRRARVAQAFADSADTLHELFCTLCALADEEAEATGQGHLVSTKTE